VAVSERLPEADRVADRAQLILGLDHHPAVPGQLAGQDLHDPGGGRDRVAGEQPHARVETAPRRRLVARHDRHVRRRREYAPLEVDGVGLDQFAGGVVVAEVKGAGVNLVQRP